MSIFKFDKYVVIEKKAIAEKRDQFYKIIFEVIDVIQEEKQIFATLHNIAFCDYLLGVKDNKRLSILLSIVNRKQKTDYILSDFYISF